MFDWLKCELREIKTPRFHLVEGTANPKREYFFADSDLPEQYKQFITQFGSARLYRRSHNNSYGLGISAKPLLRYMPDGTRGYEVGYFDGAKVYFGRRSEQEKFTIWEIESGSIRQYDQNFEEWLAERCTQLREAYGVEKWHEILRGPVPFTTEEESILEARRQIQWRLKAIDEQGNHVLEIENHGIQTLAKLTIGVRSIDQRLNGAVILNIGHIHPGQAGIVKIACYKGLRRPEELELFKLPDPAPEDREFFAEFGNGPQ